MQLCTYQLNSGAASGSAFCKVQADSDLHPHTHTDNATLHLPAEKWRSQWASLFQNRSRQLSQPTRTDNATHQLKSGAACGQASSKIQAGYKAVQLLPGGQGGIIGDCLTQLAVEPLQQRQGQLLQLV